MGEVRNWGALVFAILAVLTLGCAARPVARPASAPLAAVLVPPMTVVVLPPLVRSERIENEAAVPLTDEDAQLFAERLLNAATSAAASANVPAVVCGTAGAAKMEELCTTLGPHAGKLSRGVVPPDVRELLRRLASPTSGSALLTCSLDAKVGPGPAWDPNSGAIRSGISRSVSHAALIRADTGEVLWKNDVLLREQPEPTSPQYAAAVRMLFGLPTNEEGSR